MRQTQWPTIAVAAVMLCPLAAFAQITSVRGRVTDASGASIPKAEVTLTNQGTGESLNATTTGTGDYTFVHIPSGIYKVSVASSGFKSEERNNVHLDLDSILSVNFRLNPGTIGETVEVRADEVILNTTNADRGQTFTHDEIENSPLNGGTPLLLAATSPGVQFNGTNNGSNQFVRPFDNTAVNQFSVNGQGSDTNDFQLDGAPNNANSFGSRDIGYVPPSASVEQMKFISNPYDSQYGHTGGGVFDIVTKNGTNKLHGQVYENARRTWLDANSFFNNAQNAYNKNNNLRRAGDNRDQYGFQLDGPVVIPFLYDGHEKTFFELQGENWKQNTQTSEIDSVPALSPGSTTQTVAQTGDFSGATYYDGSSGRRLPIVIYDPLTVNPVTHVRQPFAGNKIPANRLNRAAQSVLSYVPLPNIATPQSQYFSTQNYSSNQVATDRYKTAIMRLDHNFSDRDRGYLRYTWNKRFENRPNGNIFTGPAAQGVYPLTRQNHFFTADFTHNFSSSAIFDIRLSFTRYSYNQTQGSRFDPSQLGISGIPQSATSPAFPQVNINYMTSIGNNASNGGNKLSVTNTISSMPMLTLVKGAHTIKAGLDYRWQKASNFTGSASSGYFHSDNFWTQQRTDYYQGQQDGSSLAAWLLGTPTDGRIDVNPNLYYSFPYFAPFVQDDWKINPRFTINLGMRWDFQGPPSELRNRMSSDFSQTAATPVAVPGLSSLRGGLLFAGVNGAPNTPFGWNKNLIQPRIGFAFAPNPTTVFRGGIGNSYVQDAAQGSTTGFSQSTSMNTTNSNGVLPDADTISNPFPVVARPSGASRGLLTALGSNQNISNQLFQIPGVLNYSFGFTQQMTAHDTFEVSYVGSRGYALDSTNNINHAATAFYASCDILQGATLQRLQDCVNGNNINSAHSANPFRGLDAFSTANTGNQRGYYTNAVISNGDLSRPYTAFGDINQYQRNEGKTRFDSLQVNGTHRWSDSLILRANYVWSKIMTSGYIYDQNYQTVQKHLDPGNRPWRFTMNSVWHLPVGRGRHYLGSSNRVVDGVLGGWIVSPTYYYEAGTPQRLPGGIIPTRSLPKYRTRYTERGTGIGFIRATSSCVGWYNPSKNYQLGDVPGQDYTQCSTNSDGTHGYDFIQLPPFARTYDISDTGIRNPNGQQLDLALSKVFSLYERLGLEVRLESYNALNHPSFQGAGFYFGYIGDPHWGTINELYQQQTNPPRQTQITAKITF